MSLNSLLPSIKLDLEDFEKRDRVDIWQSFNAGVFAVDPLEDQSDDMRARLESYRLSSSVLGHYKHDGNHIKRNNPGLSIFREELLVLRMHMGGSTKGLINGDPFQMSASHLTLFDFHQPIQATTRSVEYVSLVFPYSAIGYDPSCHPRFLQLGADTPVGRLLKSNLASMMELVPQSSTQQALSLAAGFMGLLRGTVMQNNRDDLTVHHLSKAQEIGIRHYVKTHLRDLDLSVERICTAMGVTRQSLYQAFQAEGGVLRAITRLRLVECYKEIAFSEPMRGAIVRVAQNWGFSDQAHFSRLFREAFGMRPGDVLGSALAIGGTSAAADLRAQPGTSSVHGRLADLYEDLPLDKAC